MYKEGQRIYYYVYSKNERREAVIISVSNGIYFLKSDFNHYFRLTESEIAGACSPIENQISPERMKELLDSIVDYFSIAENTAGVLEILFRIGFTADELVNNFGFTSVDVAPYIENEEGFSLELTISFQNNTNTITQSISGNDIVLLKKQAFSLIENICKEKQYTGILHIETVIGDSNDAYVDNDECWGVLDCNYHISLREEDVAYEN